MQRRLDGGRWDLLVRMLGMAWPVLLMAPLVAAAPPFTCSHPSGAPTLTLDPSTGAYAIHLLRGGVGALAGGTGVSLPSAPYRMLHGGRWLNSTAGGGLTLQQPPAETHSGHDQHGAWSAVDLRWQVAKGQGDSAAAAPSWVTSFRCYNRTGAVVFTQTFPDGLRGAAGGTKEPMRSVNRPSTAFPAFGLPATTLGTVSFQGGNAGQTTRAGTLPNASQQTLGMVTFQGQNAAPTTKVGTWPDASRGGYDGGPLAVFQQHDLTQGIALLSPLTQFLDTLHAKLFVSRQDIAGIRVAFFPRRQRYRC